jgi:hypothetical protein
MYWNLCRVLIMKFQSPCWNIYIYFLHISISSRIQNSNLVSRKPWCHKNRRIFPVPPPGRTSKPSLRQTWRLCFCLPSQFLHSTQPLRDLSVGQDCPVSKKQDPPNNLLQNHIAKMEGTIDNLGKTLEIQIPMWSCIQIEYPWIKWFKTSFCPLTQP